jgi:chorismate lyase / 3-hydroxybenzoate synthase
MGIQIEYLPFTALNCQPPSWQDKVLGAVSFAEAADDLSRHHLHGDIPEIHLNATVLAGSHLASEALLVDALHMEISQPLISADHGHIRYRLSEHLLFGAISLDESPEFTSSDLANTTPALQQVTEIAYQQIFALLEKLGYTHVYRFWNYMADINGHRGDTQAGLERYRQFNIGRKNVFVQVGREQGQQLPAACALGLRSGPLSIAFLAGKTAAVAIENPRQVKAYHYPEQYGPLTPSFSRATLAQIGQQLCLFISGTASIVGHETLHAGDIIGQTNETLVNLEAVVSEANRIQGGPVFDLSNACFRVYVRHAADLDSIRETLHNHFNARVKAVFIQADICREALLIEIEATVQQTMTAPAA